MTPASPEQGMLPSPCVGICRLDNATGWCLGCARDTNELASWRTLSPVDQARIWADLPRRKIILGLGFRLLPWSGEVLMTALIDLARQPNIDWSIGVYGAVAEFVTSNATIPEIEIGRPSDPAHIGGQPAAPPTARHTDVRVGRRGWESPAACAGTPPFAVAGGAGKRYHRTGR